MENDNKKDSKIDRIFNILYEIQEIQNEEHKLLVYLENQIIEPHPTEEKKIKEVSNNIVGVLTEIINTLVRFKNNEENQYCLISNIAKEFNYKAQANEV